jgi:hypothetical protein
MRATSQVTSRNVSRSISQSASQSLSHSVTQSVSQAGRSGRDDSGRVPYPCENVSTASARRPEAGCADGRHTRALVRRVQVLIPIKTMRVTRYSSLMYTSSSCGGKSSLHGISGPPIAMRKDSDMDIEGVHSPSVRRALPPVGWQSTVAHDPHWTTVEAWEKTVLRGQRVLRGWAEWDGVERQRYVDGRNGSCLDAPVPSRPLDAARDRLAINPA